MSDKKHPARHALQAIASECWAITPDALRTMLQIAARTNTAEMHAVADMQKTAREARHALLLNGGQPLAGTRTAIIRDGVAIIPIHGSIFRRANFFTEYSGGATVDAIGNDFAVALADPNVHAIILDIDSPGGQVSGINELAKAMYEARASKRIIAYVGNLAASAGYWLASAAQEIVIDETATLGSIGVIATVSNPDADPEEAGVIEFRSSNAPKKNLSPATEQGKDEIQQQIDALGDVFVEAVAKERGISTKKVLSDFGQGGVFVGSQAIEQGMADRIGTLESLLAELGSSAQSSTSSRARARHRAEQETMMPQAEDTTATDEATTALQQLANIHAALATDPVIAEKTGDTVSAIHHLIAEAQDGRTYRADLVTAALGEGVRAFGVQFDEETYRDMLANASLDRIKKVSADWKKLGDQQLAGPRQSVDDDEQEPTPPVAGQTVEITLPTHLHAA